MTSPRPIAIAIVQSHQDELLIGQRDPSVVLGGYWEFPGGKVESGETADQAAVRECLEETGLTVRVDRLFLLYSQTYDHGVVDLHFFLCRPIAETAPRPPFRWVHRGQLQQFTFPEGNQRVLAMLVGEGESGTEDLG